MAHVWSSCCLIALLRMIILTECRAMTQKSCAEDNFDIYGVRGFSVSLPCFSTDQEPPSLTFTRLKPPGGNKTEKQLYPASTLPIKEQRWSLQRSSGKVTFMLQNASVSDSGQYKCEEHRDRDCPQVSRLLLKVRECETLQKVEAVLNSSVTLTCPISTSQTGPSQVIWEAVHGDKSVPLQQCPTSCTLEGNNRIKARPLCERVRTMRDPVKGTESLIIRPVEVTDYSWYRCKVEAMQYCAEVKIIVKDKMAFQPVIKECTSLRPVYAMVTSTVTLSCPAATLHPGAKQVTWGTIQGDQMFPITYCPSVCATSSGHRLLCERTRTLSNGSLIISPVDWLDIMWLWCAVNGSICSRFKLMVTEPFAQNTSEREFVSVFTKATTGLPFLSQPPEGSTEETTEVSVNVTVIMTVSVLSVFVLTALLVALAFSWRKQKKDVGEIELMNQCTVYETIVENENDDVAYSLVLYEPAEISTCDYMYSVAHYEPAKNSTFKDQCGEP